MPAGMIDTTAKVLLAQTSVTATGFSAVFSLPQAECYSLYLAAGTVTGTTPVVNAIVQTSVDNGVTWVNLPLVFPSTTATSNSVYGPLIFKPTMGIGAAGVAPTITAGTAQATNTPVNRQFMRLSYAVTGTTPVVPLTLYALTVPKGYSVS